MAEFFALLTTALTEPAPPTPTRRQQIIAALRSRADLTRTFSHGRQVLLNQAADYDHLALLLEHHVQPFPNIPDEAMPPCEFAKLNLRPEPASPAQSAIADVCEGADYRSRPSESRYQKPSAPRLLG